MQHIKGRGGRRSTARSPAAAVRGRLGYTLERAAELSGVSVSQISRIETGVSGYSDESLAKLAAAYGCQKGDLVGASARTGVLVVGDVMRDHEVTPRALDREPEYVERPYGESGPLAAIRVQCDAMRPAYERGDVIYYAPTEPPPDERLIGRACVCAARDGRMMVRVLRRGSGAGLWDLDSFAGATLRDVELAWVARVVWVRKAD